MSTKTKVLYLLKQQGEIYKSGQEIASELAISRNSVWKAINTLKKEGYNIDASTNKGYRLEANNDLLSKSGIIYYLKNKDFFDIEVHDEITSTNTVAKISSMNKIIEGKVIVAKMQSEGRGRYAKSFYSPDDSGIYFSIVLTPDIERKKLIHYSAMIANVVCHSITNITKKNAKIKWVNDIFLDEKKVAGILCEASFAVENDELEYLVIGIGINLYNPKDGFPSEIKDIAGYLQDERVPDFKNKIIASILDEVFYQYQHFDVDKITKEYKKNSFIIGRKININKGENTILATVVDINEKNELVVKLANGNIEIITSGQISIKVQKNEKE